MEKQRDTILEYFPPGDVMEKDYNYYVFKSGWIYIKRKTSAFSLFGGGRTAHILKIKSFTLILLSEEGPEKIAEWIKSKKKNSQKRSREGVNKSIWDRDEKDKTRNIL